METAENVSSGKFNTSVQNTWVNTTALNAAFGTNETNPNLIGGVLPVQFTDTSGASQNMWNFGDQNPNYLANLSLNILGNLTPFTDSSQYGTTVTQNGNVSLTAGPGGMGSNGGAMAFDGIGGDYISAPTTNTNFGSGCSTISVMINPSSSSETIINDSGVISLGMSGGALVYSTTNTSATTVVSGGSVPLNQWSHVSATKNSTYITEEVNGTVVNQTAISAAYTAPITGTMNIGGIPTSVYFSQYSPYMVLHYDSSPFIDSSGNSNPVTNTGSVSLDSTGGGFLGTPQAHFSGSNYLTSGAASNWTFLSNGSSWTWVGYVNFTSTAEQGIWATTPTASSNVGAMVFYNAGAFVFETYHGTIGQTPYSITSSGFTPDGKIHQLVAEYNASTTTATFYIDGSLKGSQSSLSYAFSSSSPASPLTIGAFGGGGTNYAGYQDEDVWINGYAININGLYPQPMEIGALLPTGILNPISISNLQIYNGAALPVSAMYQPPPYHYQPGNFGGLPAQIPLTSGNPATHTYTTPNAGYTVTDTAWDQYGGYSQATGTIPVYVGVPYASFTESPTSGQASLLVTFTDTSYRGTASGLSYNWSFGDSSGTNPYSNVIGNTTHVYAYNGVFYPNLTITNANGTSYYVGQPITLSNTQTQTYYQPTQVQLKFTDYNGAPLTGVSVIATPGNFSAPAGWINTLLGINPNVNIIGTSVGLNTDTLGVCAMPMVQSIEYSIAVKGTSALNPAETVNTTFNLFPVQTAYEIPLPTNLVPYALPTTQAATNQITYSITNTSGVSNQTYTTTYNDATGGTTTLQLFVENTTGVWIASSNYTGSAANSETFSQSEPNPNGGTYTWGFLATQAQLGNITQTQTVNFPEFINLMGAPGGWPT